MSGLLGIGLRSLVAYQSAIDIASQNLQNARTPFYSRRQIKFVESLFNGGVQIGDVRRVYDDVANQALLRSSSAMANAGKYLEGISGLEKILDSDSSSINKYLNESLGSLQELTKDVTSGQMRGSYLAKLSSIANRFRELGSEIERRKSDLNQSISDDIQMANGLIDRIAEMNKKINSVPAGERDTLLDQRNALTHELSQYLDFDTYTDNSDMLSITMSNGIELISANAGNHLSVETNSNDTSRLRIMVTRGNSTSDVTDFIHGGELYATMRLRTDALDTASAGLAKLSLTLADIFNKQNKLGVDLNGNLGSNIFTDINDPSLQTGRVVHSVNNLGLGDISVKLDDTNLLTSSDYKLVFSDATHYTLTRISDNSVVNSGTISSYPATIQADGFTATIASGSFQAGDTFTIKPTANALQKINVTMTDPSKLALGFPVAASGNTNNTGQGKINVDAILDTSNASFSVNKQLNPPISIVFLSATSYQIVNANTQAVIEGPLTYDPNQSTSIFPTAGGYDPGYRISISGTVNAGDSFNIGYNSNVSGDNRNALLMASLYTMKVGENSSMTLNQLYNNIAGDISTKTNMATGIFDSSKVVLDQDEMRYNQISGVSDLEEMTNLAEYQESYQSCAQIIQMARTIFDTLISITR